MLWGFILSNNKQKKAYQIKLIHKKYNNKIQKCKFNKTLFNNMKKNIYLILNSKIIDKPIHQCNQKKPTI